MIVFCSLEVLFGR